MLGTKGSSCGASLFGITKVLIQKKVICQVQRSALFLLHDIHAEGMTLSETFQIAAIIEKLPPSWVEFKNYLKYKRKEMSVEDLVVRLRIEEGNKAKTKGMNDKKSKGKSEYLDPKARSVKQKNQETCYNCDQPGHHAVNCKMPKWVNPRQTNMVNDNMDMIAMVSDIVAMISNVNLVAVDNKEKLYMGNSATADIKGEGDVILKMTSEKELKLTNVLYVQEIRKNLMSGWLLNKFGFCLVFESNKFVLSKNQMYVGKGYAVNVSPFAELCAKHGTRHEFSAPYSPQQNGIAERKKRTVKEMVNAMLICSGLSQDIWGEAILTATYLLNKIPHIKKNVVMESWNASFFENIFPCLTKESGSSFRLDYEVVQDKRQRDDNDLQVERQDQVEEEVEPRRGKRVRTEKSFGPDFVSFMVENEPTSYQEAVTSSEGNHWKEAIKSEIDSILQNHTWELMDLPPGCKPLGYKWIFKKKMKANGTIDKYKARLVIKGFRQCEGLDYFETYSPVTRITSIRMILAIATLRNLEVYQMDVKTEFLNRDLE
ncbi:retrovirus-related pol polyprotein from transposon TNT 1-94 [Tanacetum coccineum]